MSDERRFELDSRAERAVAWLRLAGSIVVLGCAAWMIATGPSALGWFFAILLGVLALGWMAAGARGLRRARDAGAWFLLVRRDGLTLAERGERLDIRWSDVSEVEIDEDRLVIALRRRTGDPVVLQPRYRGVGLHELGRTLAEAHRGATSRDGG